MHRIIKWYFQGTDLGYQVDTIEDEFRFNNTNLGVLFTVEYDFLGAAVYGRKLKCCINDLYSISYSQQLQ